MSIDYGALLEYAATPRQRQLLEAVIEHGSHTRAAKALGCDRRTLDRGILVIRKHASTKGWAPEHDMTRPAAEGYAIRGTSTLYDAAGNVAMQWVKTQRDQEQIEAIHRACFEAMREDLPKTKPVPAPKGKRDDRLLSLYVLTDYHLGMHAWGEETGGADWDTTIAEDLLVAWFARAIASTPNAEIAVLAQLGDFLHWDGLKALTPESGHLLDADTRFAKLVRVAIRALRRIVVMLLAKHQQVHLVMAEGNHDVASSVWLREWFAVLYENEPRVTVDQSPDPYYCVEHGDVALFFHHGHKKGAKNIDDVLVAKFRDVFGRTRHAYAHTGHRHQTQVDETPLMLIEQHRTMAAPDAYAARAGYASGRSASVITYHRQHGEVGRVVISPGMVSDATG